MQKTICRNAGEKVRIGKIVLIMKLSLILLVLALQVSARNYGQNTISLKEKDISLTELFKKIEQKSVYRFYFSSDIIPKKYFTSIHAENASLNDVMNKILSGANLSWKQLPGNKVVVTPNDSNLDKEKDMRTITGTVKDNNGMPLENVSVILKGSPTGATTSDKGRFSIEANNGDILVISAVGYQSKEITVSAGQETLEITLLPMDTNLNEVIIVGYGTTKKTDLTGSVATISRKAIENIPITRVDQMIQGKAAGVQVTSVDGTPGTGSTIRIRGGNSINGNNEPLYVVDGLIQPEGFNLNLINPQDIESLSILKDASSIAIYGARGSNGVIMVQTKRGKAGRDNLAVNVYRGWQQVPKFIDMLNAKQYAELANESSLDGGGPVLYNLDTIRNSTDWQREITRVAPITNITVNTSGGAETYRYYLSGNYVDQQGVIINSGMKRYQLRSNFEKSIFKNLKVNADINIAHTRIKNNTVSLGGQDYSSSALAYSPIAPVYNPDGSFSSRKPNDAQVYNNPVVQGTLPLNNTNNTNIFGNIGAQWEIVSGLTLKSTFGASLDFIKNNRYNPLSLPANTPPNGNGGYAEINSTNTILLQNENTVTYDKKIGDDHSITVVVGTSYQTSTTELLGANGDKFSTDIYQYNNLAATDRTTFNISSDDLQYTLFSFLGRVNYAYKGKYLVTLTGRSDGSSRFAANHKRAFFPAVALGWNLSDENFIKNLNTFSSLKVRASYGSTGNQGISPYGSLPKLLSTTGYIIGGQPILGYYASQLANPNLKWEATKQFDIGLEAGFMNNRITFELDYYSKKTSDLLLRLQLPAQTGFGSKLANIGSISNRGLELSINTINIETRNFRWQTSLNISGNRNKVLDLGGADNISANSISFGGNSTISRLVVGQSIGTFWGATYYGTLKDPSSLPKGAVNPNSNMKAGDALYVDKSGDGKFGTDDFGVIGDGNPKFFGGIGNNFTYKRFSFDFYLQGSFGNEVMNIGDAFYNTGDPLTNQFAVIADRWTPTNTNSEVPRVNSRQYIPSTRWVYKGSFVRLKSLNIGYNLSGSQIKANWINNINIYVAATNLFLITKYPYYDPETNEYDPNVQGSGSNILRGFDNTNYPQNRTYAVGINVTL